MSTSPSSSAGPQRWVVQVCQHRSCQRGGAEAVLEAFRQYQSPHIVVVESDCMGQCSSGPTVKVMPGHTWYCRLTPEEVASIVEQHLGRGEWVRDRLHPRFHPPETLPFPPSVDSP